jgi:hypothetical protein
MAPVLPVHILPAFSQRLLGQAMLSAKYDNCSQVLAASLKGQAPSTGIYFLHQK